MTTVVQLVPGHGAARLPNRPPICLDPGGRGRILIDDGPGGATRVVDMWTTPESGSLADWGTWVTIPGTDVQIRQTSTFASGRFEIRIRPIWAYDQCMTDDDPAARRQAAAPMPVFTIKAKDALAIETIVAYRDFCLEQDLTEQAAQVELALDEIEAWQRANPDQVKLPDHRHVPAGEQKCEPDGSWHELTAAPAGGSA